MEKGRIIFNKSIFEIKHPRFSAILETWVFVCTVKV